MEHTDFTFRKAWMIYTVYVLLLFTPTAKAQQTARLISLELKKFSFDDAELEQKKGKVIISDYSPKH
jgi:hypothetical protein